MSWKRMANEEPPQDAVADNRGTQSLIVNGIFMSLAIISVLGRFLSRKIKGLALGADDWTILGALVLTITGFAITSQGTYLGIGQHFAHVPPENIQAVYKNLYIYDIIYVLTPPLVKISLLLLYRRIFVQRTFHVIIWITFGVCVAWMLASFFVGVFNCTPIAGYWDKSIDATCVDFRLFSIGYAVVNVVTDVWVWILPVPNIWRLQLGLDQKLLLTGVFALGLFVWACTLVRLFTSIVALSDPDFTYVLGLAYIWSIVEPSVGILCACIPTLKVLLVELLPFFKRRFAEQSTYVGHATHSSTNKSPKRRSKWSKSRNDPYHNLEESLRTLDPRIADSVALAERSESVPSQTQGPGFIRVKQDVDVTSEPRANWHG